jgi:hypothetical protein
VAGEAKGMGVGLGYGEAATHTRSLEAKRNRAGGIDAETEIQDGEQQNASLSMNALGMGVKVGRSRTRDSTFGYSITIDPKQDPDGKILEALGTCRTREQYAWFMAAYKGKFKLTGKTEGSAEAESLETGVSVAGVDVFSMGEGHGTDQKTKTDADGKLVGKTVGGHGSIGGKLLGLADSKNDDALAEVGADGTATMTLTTTTHDNHNGRSRDKRAKAMQARLAGKGPQQGVLTRLAGGDDADHATHDVSSLQFSNDDLKRLGGVACRSLDAWVGLRRRADEKDDLRKAGIAIAKAKGAPAVVAEQLTLFVGGDSIERLETVRRMARGGYNARMGSASEFPDSIRGLQEDYATLVDAGLVGKINAIGGKDQAKARQECERLLKICDPLMTEISACKDFSDPGIRAEMLGKLERVRQNLAVSAKGFAGEKPVADAAQLAADGGRLLKQCYAFYADQAGLVAELHELKGDYKRFRSADKGDARKLIRKLRDLVYRWRSQWYLLKENYQARGLAEGGLMIHGILPDETIVNFWEEACGD